MILISSIAKEYSRFRLLSDKDKEIARKISNESPAYACIGKKCVFCKEFITKYDITAPNMVMESLNGNVAHGQCMDYCVLKHPDKSVSEMEGKVVRNPKFGF